MTSRSRKLGVPVVALLVVVVLVWMLLPDAIEIDVGRVTRDDLRVTVNEEGRTRVRERYVVSAPLAGRLGRIALRAGDPVAAGRTVLAVIEPTDPSLLDARAVAEAEARVRAATAAQEQAASNLGRARATLGLAAKELERAKELFETEVISRQELDETETRERVAAGEVGAARAAVEVAEFELEVARAALVHVGPDGANGGAFEIRSPIDGRVLRRFEESETVVTPGTSLLEIADPTDLEVVIDVLSSDAVRIRPGAKVSFEHWGGEQPLEGSVRVVEPGGFTKVSALGVEEQRVNVIADFVDPRESRPTLGDGFRVDARIVVWEGTGVLTIPTGALFRHAGEWATFQVDGGRARLVTLDVGQRNDHRAEVLAGLEEDQGVVLHPSDRVEDGARVTRR